MIELAQAHAIPEIAVPIDCADAALMRQVREAGLDFGCFAAHTAAQIDRALALGIKVFTTDRPSLAIARRALHRGRRHDRHHAQRHPQELCRWRPGAARRVDGHPRRRIRGDRRPLGLRQVHASAHDRRAGDL
ncbi:hypothetical protein [Ponticoccus litoralis]|uniref:Glycerophosphoryl diester phosphodiesterase family protein n=1 Tax=Ponticoccus litoralis TaxID=422297 RepID=A0AAW9SQT7_9RHOB